MSPTSTIFSASMIPSFSPLPQTAHFSSDEFGQWGSSGNCSTISNCNGSSTTSSKGLPTFEAANFPLSYVLPNFFRCSVGLSTAGVLWY